MAKKADAGITIGIDGEKEFRHQIENINASLKATTAEMKAVTSAFASNEQGTEALTAQNKILSNSITALNDRLAVEQEMLKQTVEAYGSASPQADKMRQAVYKTTAQINTMTAQVERNNSKINENGTILGKLGSTLGGFTDKLGLGNTALGKMANSMSSGTLAATTFWVAIVKLTADLVKLSDAATKHGDEVSTLATKYNMTAQTVQKLQYMAELTDTSFETVSGAITKLTRNMDSARDGTGAAAEAFAALGVSVTNSDGSLRSANDVFAESIDALGNVGNETERDALAMQIFGKSAMELNPLIAQGSENLKALADEAANSGYVMSDQMIDILREGDDATQRLDKAMEGLKNTIGAGVTPIVARWKMVLADAANGMAVFIQNLAGMRDGADEVTDAVNGATAAVSGFQDVTSAKDLMSQDQKDYVRYLQTMGDYYKSLGISSSYVEDYGLWSQNNQRMASGQSAIYDSSRTINVAVQLDSQTIARATYDANLAEANRRGPRAIK